MLLMFSRLGLKISENEALEILKVASRRIGLDRIGDGDYAIDNGTHTFPLYVPCFTFSASLSHECTTLRCYRKL